MRWIHPPCSTVAVRHATWFGLAVLVCFVGVGGPGEPSFSVLPSERGSGADLVGPTVAHGNWEYAQDTDLDGLPDEVEWLIGSEPLLSDSDGDFYGDGVEWVCGGDFADPAVQPTVRPALRTVSYQAGNVIRIFTGMFPGAPSLVESFEVVIGSSDLGVSPGDLGLVPATSLLSQLVQSVSATRFYGLNVIGLTMELSTAMARRFSPLTLGLSTKVT